MINLCLEAVETELSAAGVPYKVEQGGKHIHILFGESYQHLHVVAKTPSDFRAHKNERALIRRSLAQLGYVDIEEEMPQSALVTLSDGSVSCASYHVAQHFSKAHKDVLRAIDRVRDECGREFDQRNFAPIDYLDEKGRTYRAYRMSRDGFTLVAMGFTGRAAMDWKIKYIAAFNALEGEVKALSAQEEIRSLRAELDTVVGLLGELETKQQQQSAPPPEPEHQPVQFIRASVLRKLRRLA